jgi:hypothetical protein
MAQTTDTRTQWRGKILRLVYTAGVNDRIADDTTFAKHVYASLIRFNRGDWGDTDGEDAKQNDATLAALNGPDGWYGMILASYDTPEKIWITRQTTDEDGTQSLTVLLPSEY